MLIMVYFILVVIVILLLVAFNVRTVKKRRATTDGTAEKEEMDSAVREGTVGREEPNPIAVATMEKGAAGFADLSEGAGEKPARADWQPAVRKSEESPAAIRRSSAGMDFRGALREMSSGEKGNPEASPAESPGSGAPPMTDNDYRNALRSMKRVEKDRR